MKVYDFSKYNTRRLLGNFSRQAGKVCIGMAAFRANLFDIGHGLDRYADALMDFDLILNECVEECKGALIRSKECQKALENGEIDEVINYRDELKKNHYGKKVCMRNGG